MQNHMDMHPDADNYIAINVLETLNIKKPSQHQLYVASLLVGSMAVRNEVLFNEKLTHRERCCLFWTAKGLTSREVADLLGIKKDTVNGYRKSITQKLGCKNMAQSIFEGMRFGYLNACDFTANSVTKQTT